MFEQKESNSPESSSPQDQEQPQVQRDPAKNHYADMLDDAGETALAAIVRSETAEACVQAIQDAYPHIAILGDAASYGGDGNEVKRTLKSTLNLTRFVNDDGPGLGGEAFEKLAPGIQTLRGLCLEGIQQLDDPQQPFVSGYRRLMDILSIHDLAKSEVVARVAEDALGCSDHDMALAALVRDNFDCLDGVVPDEYLASLRAIIADDVVHDFFSKPRAISGFNAGRHMRGEAPRQLFLDAVKGVDAACLAEFIADWSGVDGHKDQTGPMFLSHIPPAINGTATSLETLLKAGKFHSDLGEIWKEFSYPEDICASLELSTDTDKGLALTRIAFMAGAHQLEPEAGRYQVRMLKQTFEDLPKGMQDQLIVELTAEDLDLGFTPHTISDIRAAFQAQGYSEQTESVTRAIYETTLTMLHRVIDEVRAEKIKASVITVNFEAKSKGSRLADVINPATTPAGSVAEVALELTVDSNNVVAVQFQKEIATSLDWRRELDSTSDLNIAIEGESVLIGGIGGGGDLYQGAAFAELLRAHGKHTAGVFSVRRGNLADVQQSLEDCHVIDKDHGIIEVFEHTAGVIGTTTRLPERGVAKALSGAPAYLILDNDEGKTLEEKIDALAKYLGKEQGIVVDTVVGVDTGGDSLEPMHQDGGNTSRSTPDQDHTSVAALSRLAGYHSYTVVAAAGIDSPEDFVDALYDAEAVSYSPTEAEQETLSDFYEKTGLGQDESVYSKTSLICKALVSDGTLKKGYQFVDGIPLEKRISRSNPWKSWVNLQPAMQAYCIMKAQDHLGVISDQ